MWLEAAEQRVDPGPGNPEPLNVITELYCLTFYTEKNLILELGTTYVWEAGKIQQLGEMMAEGVSTIESWNHLQASIHLSCIDVDRLLGPRLGCQLVSQWVFACGLGFLTAWQPWTLWMFYMAAYGGSVLCNFCLTSELHGCCITFSERLLALGEASHHDTQAPRLLPAASE